MSNADHGHFFMIRVSTDTRQNNLLALCEKKVPTMNEVKKAKTICWTLVDDNNGRASQTRHGTRGSRTFRLNLPQR